jgi:hypothetical protein
MDAYMETDAGAARRLRRNALIPLQQVAEHQDPGFVKSRVPRGSVALEPIDRGLARKLRCDLGWSGTQAYTFKPISKVSALRLFKSTGTPFKGLLNQVGKKRLSPRAS